MGRDAVPSSGTPVAVEPPTPPRSSHTPRASPSRPRSYVPGGSARLGSAAAARLLGRESRGSCAGGANPELRPGPNRAPPVRSQRLCARPAGASPRKRAGARVPLDGQRPTSARRSRPAHPSPRLQGGPVGKETLLGSLRVTKATWGRRGAHWVRPRPAAQGRPKGAADSARRPSPWPRRGPPPPKPTPDP